MVQGAALVVSQVGSECSEALTTQTGERRIDASRSRVPGLTPVLSWLCSSPGGMPSSVSGCFLEERAAAQPQVCVGQ